MPNDDEIINAALSGEPNTDEVNYLTLLSSYDGKLTLLQWLKKSVAYYQQGIDQFSADHNQVELNRLNIADLEGRVYTLEQKPACLPLTGGTLNGGLDVMGRLAVVGKVGQDPMLEVGEGVADSHLSIQANKSLYSRVFTPTNSAYTFVETMRDGVFEWTIESQSNGETKTAKYRLPYGANMPTGNHFLALHDEVTAEATTRNNQITGLRDAVTGVNNALSEEVTNRENADTALSERIAINTEDINTNSDDIAYNMGEITLINSQVNKLGISETEIKPTLPVISPYQYFEDDSIEFITNDEDRALSLSYSYFYIWNNFIFFEVELLGPETTNHSEYDLTIKFYKFESSMNNLSFNGVVSKYKNDDDYSNVDSNFRPAYGVTYEHQGQLFMNIHASPSNSTESYADLIRISGFTKRYV